MIKFFIDSETRSYWNGNEEVCLDEGDWLVFLERKKKEQKDGLIKLVEIHINRNRADRGVATL